MEKSDIGVFGLGVMGQSLALNLADNGQQVSVYNRMEGDEKDILDNFLTEKAEGKNIVGCYSIEEFVGSLTSPRTILLMVSAGKAVDAVISQLKPHLEKGDIIIDGGNSHFADTQRRVEDLKLAGLHLVGMGVSGGEEGARFGPSMMPGGSEKAWETIKPMMESIAANANDGSPCCQWIGNGGAGHFVKMVHNGIEYGDMQIIAEATQLMSEALGMEAQEISETFQEWNKGKLNGYLTEITADIFSVSDTDGEPLVDKILDAAGQKGTGRWTVITALELGVPLPVITAAVFSRSFSAFKNLRKQISKNRTEQKISTRSNKSAIVKDLERAMIAARMVTLAEGFFLIKSASDEHGWNINVESVAKIWRGGCIIRSAMLEYVISAFSDDSNLTHLLEHKGFYGEIEKSAFGLESIVGVAATAGIPIPAMSAAMNQFYTLQSKNLPANIIQAQRDYFGAHTYERVDRPRGEFFHTQWKE
ncbi:MAG: decarboxylating NADP(+)-dependent phosphogluconate dehydrogenase [Balneolaceae bacterium]